MVMATAKRVASKLRRRVMLFRRGRRLRRWITHLALHNCHGSQACRANIVPTRIADGTPSFSVDLQFAGCEAGSGCVEVQIAVVRGLDPRVQRSRVADLLQAL